MAQKKYDILPITVIVLVALIVYIVLLTLMWNWYANVDRFKVGMDPMLGVLVTGILVGLMAFVGYIILSHSDSDAKLTCLMLWGLSLQTLITAYVCYFSRDLKVESSYLLIFTITLEAVMLSKMWNVNKYGSFALLVAILLTLFLTATAMQSMNA